jgi:hypothetical protein
MSVLPSGSTITDAVHAGLTGRLHEERTESQQEDDRLSSNAALTWEAHEQLDGAHLRVQAVPQVLGVS